MLSMDSHIFLRLITSFEPLFLMANFLVGCVCLNIHEVTYYSRPHAKDLALHDFGGTEWAYVILTTTALFSSCFVFVCGFQDAFPDSVRNKAAVAIGAVLSMRLRCPPITAKAE